MKNKTLFFERHLRTNWRVATFHARRRPNSEPDGRKQPVFGTECTYGISAPYVSRH